METQKWAAMTLVVAGAVAACAVPNQGTATPAVAVAAPPATIVIQPPVAAAPPQTVYVAPPAPRTVYPVPAIPVAQTVIAYYDALNRRDFSPRGTSAGNGWRKAAVMLPTPRDSRRLRGRRSP